MESVISVSMLIIIHSTLQLIYVCRVKAVVPLDAQIDIVEAAGYNSIGFRLIQRKGPAGVLQ